MGLLDAFSSGASNKESALLEKLEDKCESGETGNVVACRLALNMKVGKLRLGQGKALTGGLLSTVGDKLTPQEELVVEEALEEIEEEQMM